MASEPHGTSSLVHREDDLVDRSLNHNLALLNVDPNGAVA